MSGFGKRRVRRRHRARPGAASSRSALTALLVALSLLVQLIAIPYHQALAAPEFAQSETAKIAAELKATFGDAAALCVEVDGKGAPLAPAGHCDDQCPLCRFAAQAATLVAPDAPALLERLDAGRQALGAASDPGGLPFRLENCNRARAPPLTV
ncbi:MAG TPA: hypothetical protein VKG91_01430 [Roseiarcus sp.]|nr:hypothetical protein [Roseiarcus sp.]